MQLAGSRSVFEVGLSIIIILGFSLMIGVLGVVSLKLQLLLLVALAGVLVVVLSPARRTLCLCLWVLIQPLSVEKILFTSTPIWDGLRGYEIVLNAGDLLLLILACILVYEQVWLKKKSFSWDGSSKLLFAIFVWGGVSFLVHSLFLHSPYVDSASLGLLHLFRNFIFVFIIGSAIQTRNDLLWILACVAGMIFIQSILVGISFSTGESMNFTRLLGPALKSQTYEIGGNVISRAAGTLGVPNQQAVYHAMFTFLAIGLIAVKNALFRFLAMLAIVASLFAVIFTFSRSAWLTMFLATVLSVGVFLKRQEVSSTGLLVGSVLSLFMIIGLAFVANPIIDRLTKGDDGATDSRVRMIKLASDLIVKHPIIGVGPNDYAEAGLYYYPPGEKEVEWVALGDKAIVPPLGRIELAVLKKPGEKALAIPLGVHNKYLLVFSELGIVGLLLWISFFVVIFNAARQLKNSPDKVFRYLSVSGYSVVLVIAIYMLLDLFADDKTLQVILFPMVLIAAANRVNKQQSNKKMIS